MWLSAILPLGLFFLAAVTASGTEICNPKACHPTADVTKPICGSDGLTYPNRCIFERTRCKNRNLTLSKRGPCKLQRGCLEWDSFLLANPLYNNSFKPKCRPDGTYELVQCHPDTDACWCVTPEGVPLPYTISRPGNPRCGRKRKTTRRRSPSRKHKGRCKRTEKATLNNNLINSFHSEFNRNSGRNESDTVVITWKFQTLDLNGDEVLDKSELRDLRKVVKKAVRPKRCAKNFPKSCDVDNDQFIGLQEWAECLTRDGMDDGRVQSTSNDSGDDSEDYEEPFSPQRTPPHGVLRSTVLMGQNYDEESSEIREETEPTDCLSDRNVSLSEGYQQLYVPECTPDGRYQKVQCYKSAGYCWCVNEDTGKNIPGTSVKNGIPKCDQLKTSNKTMKGCPDDKKLIFLKELLQFLHSRMSEIVNSTSSFTSLAWIASKEEQAATWSFVVFDKNKNKMLERNEWKAFKDMVSTIKGLRKCGKKLPRYCDSNKDRQISMTEWLECLNVQQGVSTYAAPPSSRAGKKNPLSMLKDD